MVERVVEGMVEAFWRTLDLYMTEYVDDEGRPIFARALTVEEQLARFEDDVLREGKLREIAEREGLVAAVEWKEKMQSALKARMNEGQQGD